MLLFKNSTVYSWVKLIVAFASLITLVACGASGGGESATNPGGGSGGSSTSSKQTASFTGSINAANEDQKHFRNFVWNELAHPEVCGACHIPGGNASSFPFADPNSIVNAYNAAISYVVSSSPAVSLTNPATSGLATYVASGDAGHNCWLGSDKKSDCETAIVGYISKWAAATAPSSFMAALKQFAPEDDELNDVSSGPQFVTTVTDAAYSELHTLLTGAGQCSQCHAPSRPASLDSEAPFLGPQQPYFAVDDMQSSYDAIKTKLDINNTSNSRIYDRLNREAHNCWSNSCSNDASEILEAINELIGGIPQLDGDGNVVRDAGDNIVYDVEPLPIVGLSDELTEVASKALVVGVDGLVLSSNGSRVDDNAIALWDFKKDDSAPFVAANKASSGIPLNLTFKASDNIEWWKSGGVRIIDGQLTVSDTEAKKLAEAITGAGEYSIEAWVIPLNISQGENTPASIVSYSQETDSRNFMLNQRIYNYDFYNRNTLPAPAVTDKAGDILASDAPGTINDEVAQASLQHVVVTFNEIDGRRIYVNGELIIEEADPDAATTESFDDWQDDYLLVVGNEASGGRQWQGSIRLLAIHNTALGIDDINTNYEIGVGDKYYLMFSLAHLTPGLSDTYVVFRVEEFDDHSYLFSEPLFYTEDGVTTISGLEFSGMRIGINSREASSGQAFINLAASIDSTGDDYIFDEILDDDGVPSGIFNDENGGMQRLSRIGTLIPLENGIDEDEFFLTFDSIAGVNYARATPSFVQSPVVPDDTEQSDIGLKNFAEINASLSALTGISAANSEVVTAYEKVKQQMPSTEAINGFVSAQQMGVTQLAFKYCSELVNAGGNTTVNFGGFDLSASDPSVAFDTDAKKAQIIDPLLANLLADGSAVQTSDQPTPGTFGADDGTRDLLADLIDTIVTNNLSSTPNIVKATCAAAYGSAMMLIQ